MNIHRKQECDDYIIVLCSQQLACWLGVSSAVVLSLAASASPAAASPAAVALNGLVLQSVSRYSVTCTCDAVQA